MESQRSEPIALTYRLTEADFFAMMDRYWRLTPARFWRVRALQAFVIGSGFVAAFLAWHEHDWVFAVFAALLLSAPITAPMINRWVYRCAFRAQRLGLFDVHVTLDDEGLGTQSERGKATYFWKAVERIDATPAHAFLWVNPRVAIILPAAAFEDAAAFNRAVDFCKARVQGQRSVGV
jgi:hypothetical protein